MSLKVSVETKSDSTYVVRLAGSLDTETYFELEKKTKELLTSGAKSLIFDMDKLVYISSAGLGVLFRTQKAVEERSGSFIMLNVKPQVKKVFEVIKALPKESVFETMEEVDMYLNLIQKREREKQNPSQAA